MAVRHRLIKARPGVVWDVLADGGKYPQWVVGPSGAEPVRGQWPQTDAAIRYEVPFGPFRLSNETIVRRCEEGVGLELEAHAGPLGTARIAIELRPWSDDCLVIVDEHPLQGAGGLLHNAGFEVLIQLRHRAMLARLARLCESEAGNGKSSGAEGAGSAPDGSNPAETPGPAGSGSGGAPGPGSSGRNGNGHA
ncbi:SRPBCC family protein [Streptomyces griseosporeus]|uniref:SRPBCC family protein n=1 Tax=Streptomyces griseosporeus TaxID=1910 RepID=UPI0036FC96F3